MMIFFHRFSLNSISSHLREKAEKFAKYSPWHLNKASSTDHGSEVDEDSILEFIPSAVLKALKIMNKKHLFKGATKG